MQISHDKNLLACGTSSGVSIYDINDTTNISLVKILIKEIKKGTYDYPKNVTSIGFKGNSDWIYAGSEDGTVRVHDIRLSNPQVLHKNDCEINAVMLSPTEVIL